MRNPLAYESRTAFGNKQFQTFDCEFIRMCVAAYVEPQDAKGQRRINGDLRLLAINAQYGESGAPTAQQPASVDRPKGSLEVHGCAQPQQRPAGEHSFQNALQATAVDGPGCALHGRAPTVPLATDLEFGGMGLAEALDGKPQGVVLALDREHS